MLGFRHYIAVAFAGVIAISGLLMLRPSAGDSATIILDPTVRFQQIDGWLVHPRYWEHDKANDRFDASVVAYTDELSAFLVDRVGISGVHLGVWSGAENPVAYWTQFYRGEATYKENKEHRYEKINDNDDPFSINPDGFQFGRFDFRFETMVWPLMRAMEARGERLRINVNYVDFKGGQQGSLSHAENPEEFAEFVLAVFEHIRSKYGVIPDGFEVVLEPDNTRDWRGAEVGRGLLAAKRRLAEHGFEPEILAPSTAHMSRAVAYFDEMIEVPGVLDALDVFSYHRYGPQRTEDVAQIGRRARQYDLKTAMLERIGAGIDELIEDLTVANVSSWEQWAVAGFEQWEGGAFYLLVNLDDPENPRIRLAERTRLLAPVFLSVRPGAVRIEASSTNDDKAAVAFVTPDGRIVAVVRAKDSAGRLTVQGLPAGDYSVAFTGDDQPARALPEVAISAGQDLQTEVPAPGVLVIEGH